MEGAVELLLDFCRGCIGLQVEQFIVILALDIVAADRAAVEKCPRLLLVLLESRAAQDGGSRALEVQSCTERSDADWHSSSRPPGLA